MADLRSWKLLQLTANNVYLAMLHCPFQNSLSRKKKINKILKVFDDFDTLKTYVNL